MTLPLVRERSTVQSCAAAPSNPLIINAFSKEQKFGPNGTKRERTRNSRQEYAENPWNMFSLRSRPTRASVGPRNEKRAGARRPRLMIVGRLLSEITALQITSMRQAARPRSCNGTGSDRRTGPSGAASSLGAGREALPEGQPAPGRRLPCRRASHRG